MMGSDAPLAARELPLLSELNALKRIRAAGKHGSLATQLFRRGWAAIIGGETLEQVALRETAHAVVAARLAAIDAGVLSAGGLPLEVRASVLRRGLDAFAAALDPALFQALHATIDGEPRRDLGAGAVPRFVEALAAQPRAGATRPGRARVMLEPAESHAEHCALVAVYGVLLAPRYGAEVGQPFLAGLAHHLHNAYLPDAGYAGDELLGDYASNLTDTFRAQALAELPMALRDGARAAALLAWRSDLPAAQAFQAADVLDRVLEMRWHAETATFTLDVALQEMDIVHPGPVQAFQLDVMRDAGLM